MAAKKTVEVPGEALHGHVDVPGGAAGKVSAADSPWADRAHGGAASNGRRHCRGPGPLVAGAPGSSAAGPRIRGDSARPTWAEGASAVAERAACFGLGGLTLNEFR